MLVMCMKLCNWCINCTVLLSVIWFVLLLHIVIHKICLRECQSVLTNDLELTKFYNIHAQRCCIDRCSAGFMSCKQVKHPVATSRDIQHFGPIQNRNRIVRNGHIGPQQGSEISYITIINILSAAVLAEYMNTYKNVMNSLELSSRARRKT